jgi:hypothetical protein
MKKVKRKEYYSSIDCKQNKNEVAYASRGGEFFFATNYQWVSW